MTSLNLPFLAGVLAFLVLASVAAHFWHARQLSRLSLALLERAKSLEQDEAWKQAASAAEQYLGVHPDDSEAIALYARVIGNSARSRPQIERAVRLYDRAIGVAPADGRIDLIRDQAGLLLRVGRFNDAAAQSRLVLESAPEDPDALRVAALAKAATVASKRASAAEVQDVIRQLEQALESNAGDVSLSVTLANLLRTQGNRPDEADAVIEGLLTGETEDSADAERLLAAIEYRRRYELPGIDGLIDRALSTSPKNYGVRLAAANRSAKIALDKTPSGGEPDAPASAAAITAIDHYRAAIELSPADQRAHLGLAYLQERTGDPGQAQSTLRSGLRACGEEPLMLLLLAEILVREQSEQANAMFERLDLALNSSPGSNPALRLYRDQAYAEWLTRQGRLQEASALLERIAIIKPSTLGGEAGLQLKWRALTQLGQICAEAGRWDQAARVFDRAVAEDPENINLRLAAADAWARSDQASTAAERYRSLSRMGVSDPHTTSQIRLAYAGQLYRLETRKPPSQRNWAPLLRVLADAAKAKDVSWRLKFIEADLALVPGAVADLKDDEQRRQRALTLLREAEEEHPQDPELFSRLAIAYERVDASEDADRAIIAAGSILQSPAAYAILTSEIARSRGDTKSAITALEEAMPEAPEGTRSELALQVARLRIADEGLEAGKAALTELCERHPNNPSLPELLLELILSGREEPREDVVAQAERWLAHLAETAADSSIVKYYRARTLLLKADSAQDREWVEAVRLQTEIEASRPGWTKPHLLNAMLARARGNHAAAAESLKRVILLGEASPEVVAMLTDSLYRENRFAEATQYLSLVSRLVPRSDSLSSLAISVAVGLGNSEGAVELARQRVDEQPDDPLPRVWLGQTLMLAGRVEEAAKELRTAVDMAPEDIRTWNGLFAFYVMTQDKQNATETLTSMTHAVDLSASQREFALAQGYEALRDYEQARTHYERASALDSSNSNVRQRMAAILAREDPQKAAEILRPLAEESEEARRMLATILAGLGGEANLAEALSLVQGNASRDRRTRALLLARYGDDADRVLSRQLFEGIVKDPAEASITDRLLLARLYEFEGQTQLAREQFRLIASQPDAQPMHLAAFVDFLLRTNQWDDAAVWLDQLAQQSADPLLMASLRARLLQGKGEASAVEEEIDRFVSSATSADQPRLSVGQALSQASNIASDLDRFDLTEKYLRRLMEISPKVLPALAVAIARQGRTLEAVEMCLKQWRDSPAALPAQSLAMVLMVDAESAEANEAAEPVIGEILEQFSDNTTILNTIGAVRHLQRRYGEAIDVYRQALEIQPNDATTLNNLVTLLGEIPAHREKALQLADECLKRDAKSPPLLDAKAMTLYHAGQYQECERILSRLLRAVPNDARYRFHLALAQRQIGELDKAVRNLNQAQTLRLSTQILTPLERQLLDELIEAIEATSENKQSVSEFSVAS